jgi:hypothetical protein
METSAGETDVKMESPFAAVMVVVDNLVVAETGWNAEESDKRSSANSRTMMESM